MIVLIRNLIDNHTSKCNTFLTQWEYDNDRPHSLWRIKNVNKNRQTRAEQKSVLWLERMLQWHVKSDNNKYFQLLSVLFEKHKSLIFEQFGWKRIQLSLEQAHEFQQIIGMLNWQMVASQKYFRVNKGVLLYPNDKDRRDYRKQFWILSAQVHLLILQIVLTFVKRQQLHFQNVKVYHINEIESLGQLCTSIFNNGRFYIQQPLSKDEWLYTSGWDRSVEGLAQSGCLGITKHFHGKYSSIIQTLTSENVAENETNYRELNNHWGKKDMTNQMLKFPTMIIIAVIHRDENNNIISKAVESCVMCLNKQGQKQANKIHGETMNRIPGPRVESFNINQQQINNAMNASNDLSLTETYWQNRSQMLNLDAFIAVQLPKGFNPTTDTSNINMNLNEAHTQAMKLLIEGKSVQYRYKPKDDQKNNDNSNENANADDQSETPYMTRFRAQQSQQSNNNDNNNNNNDNNNNNNANISDIPIDNNDNDNSMNRNLNNVDLYDSNYSTSDYDINNDNPRSYDSDGNSISDVSKSESELSDDDSPVHRLHPLCRWNFNCGSRLNRLAESDWNWQRKHCRSSVMQGNTLYLLKFEDLSTHIWNVELPRYNTNEIADTLTRELLFDQINGVKYIYLPHDWIPDYDEEDLPMNRLFAITLQDFLIGLLQLHVTTDKHHATDHRGDTNGRKCLIFQRCLITDPIDLGNVNWDEKENYKYKNINNNANILDEIGSINVKYDSQYVHQLHVFRIELKTYLQFDNSAKNMVAGISKASSKNPCAICEASGQQIYSFPDPLTMCFVTRNQLQTVARSLHLSKSEKHHKGCKETPIWDCPVHRYAPTTLHDFEGIFAVVLHCLKCYINKYTNSNQSLIELQDYNKYINELYAKLAKLQDAQHFLADQPQNEQIKKEKQLLTEQILPLKREFEQEEKKWIQELEMAEQGPLQQYLKILKKFKINEYYCMKNSVQGIMCKRICQARKELVAVAKSVNSIGGILWELLFENLNFVYYMLKIKYHDKFKRFELASVKHAYIDFYHQLVLAVRVWRDKGDLTIKPHYLVHDLEYCLSESMSTAFVDEERIENVNQHVKGAKRLYHSGAGNQYGCREMLVGRRMNDRVLSCG